MPSKALAASIEEDHSVDLPDGLRYVARQPILDRRGRVYAYELLYRRGTERAFHGDCELAARTVLDNTILFGVEQYIGSSLAFINCTAETLTQDLVGVLRSRTAVLELLETVEPTAELLAACVKFKTKGFRIALDDFVWAPRFAPLVELADYIKVDFLLTPPADRQELLTRIRDRKITLLAEKVETQEDYQTALQEGFKLFQGYYFCRPELIENRKIPSNSFCHFEILRLLQGDPIDWDRLSQPVKRDESLTYRLLRLVNSAGYGIREEIRSVRAAMVHLGEESFRRVAMLAIATELNTGKPPEILRMALVRARFCELAAAYGRVIPSEQYLLGMLSLLPAMLGVPMERLTPELPLRKEIRDALEGKLNRDGQLLEWLKKHECGEWAACDAMVQSIGIEAKQLYSCYTEAVIWVENQFRVID